MTGKMAPEDLNTVNMVSDLLEMGSTIIGFTMLQGWVRVRPRFSANCAVFAQCVSPLQATNACWRHAIFPYRATRPDGV